MDSSARSLLAAVAMHAAGIGAVLLLGSRVEPDGEAPEDAVDVELLAIDPESAQEARKPGEPEPAGALPSPGLAAPAPVRSVTPRAAAKLAPAPQPTAGAAEPPASSPAAAREGATPTHEARNASGWVPRAVDLDALGLGKRNVFVTAEPRPIGPAEAPPKPGRDVQQAMRDAIRDHDRALGLGADGPVIALAEEVARRSLAAVNSRAVFVVTADATGTVTSVQLGDVSEDTRGWIQVAAMLRDALRARKLRVSPGANGVAVTIAVTSRLQLPSGSDPETEVSIAGIPVKRARGGRPAVRVDVIPILSVIGDPSDIGAQAVRIVHARTLGQTDF